MADLAEDPGAGSPEVVVVGNVGVDTSVFVDGTPSFDREGNFSCNLDSVGQAGGYSSRGFAQLGRRTAFVGHVGDDPLGRWVRAELASDGIDLRGLGVDPAGTARSVNVMGAQGARCNFYDGKGHQSVEVDKALARDAFDGARLALFHLPDWARRLLPVARAAGVTVACDLQDVRDPDDPYRADFLAAADILFASAAHHEDARHLVRALMSRSPARVVLCGLGASGVAVGVEGTVRIIEPPPVDLALIDTNGAGDALAVGFLTSYVLAGRSLEESVLRGQVAARWTCTQRATSSSLITADLLEDLITHP